MYNMNTEVINDEPFSLYSLITYIIDNVAGLSLFVLAIFIIIFVDYISRLNSIIFSGNSPIVLPTAIPGGIQIMNISKPQKLRKFRKR